MLVNPDLIIKGKQWPINSRATAAALSVSASIAAILTAGFTTAGDGGGANYIKGTSALDGFTDASGTNWKLDPNQFVYTPEMFGRLDTTTTERTATLKKFFDYIITNKKPGGIRAGYYLVNGVISNPSSYADCSLNLRTIGGPVKIEYDAAATATEYFIVAISNGETSHCIDATQGELTIIGNDKIQRGISLSSNSGSTTPGGSLFVEGVNVTGMKADLGAPNGVAYGIDISGPFAHYHYENNHASYVSRHTSFDLTGDCKGHRISQVCVPFFSNSGSAEYILNAVQDADGIFVSGSFTGGASNAPASYLGTNWHFRNCQGRSAKFQAKDAGVFRGNIVHDDALYPTINNSTGFQNQYGSLKIFSGWSLTADANTLGASYVPFFIQASVDDGTKFSFIDKGLLLTDNEIINVVYVQNYALGPIHTVSIDSVHVLPKSTLATTVITRGFVETDMLPLQTATAKKVNINVRNTVAANTLPLIAYTGYNNALAITDLSGLFGFEAVNNKTVNLTPTSSTSVFRSLSGNSVIKLTDYLINNNTGYSDFMPVGWVVDFTPNKMRGGNQFSFDIATSLAAMIDGPTSYFPSTGIAYVSTESQAFQSSGWLPVHIRIDNQIAANMYHYRTAGTWRCPVLDAIGAVIGNTVAADADLTLTPRVSNATQIFSTVTAPRTVTLSNTGVKNGDWFRIVVPLTAGAGTVTLGSTGTALVAGQSAMVTYTQSTGLWSVVEKSTL